MRNISKELRDRIELLKELQDRIELLRVKIRYVISSSEYEELMDKVAQLDYKLGAIKVSEANEQFKESLKATYPGVKIVIRHYIRETGESWLRGRITESLLDTKDCLNVIKKSYRLFFSEKTRERMEGILSGDSLLGVEEACSIFRILYLRLISREKKFRKAWPFYTLAIGYYEKPPYPNNYDLGYSLCSPEDMSNKPGSFIRAKGEEIALIRLARELEETIDKFNQVQNILKNFNQ